MKTYTRTLALLTVAVLQAGCASVFNRPTQAVAVSSSPGGASFTVKNRAGEMVCSGVTPQTVNLKTSSGYFRGESYTLSFKKGGSTTTVPLDAGISPWYFGNFLIGGVIGMLVIDPLTGSMWTLEDSVAAQLGGLASAARPGSLRIVERSSVPVHLASHLKPVPANIRL